MLKVIQDITQFIQPMLLSELITWVAQYGTSNGEAVHASRGVLIASEWILCVIIWMTLFAYLLLLSLVGMFVAAVVQMLFQQQYFQLCYTAGMQVRAALVTAIYRKTLVLSNSSRQQSTVGEVSCVDKAAYNCLW